MKVPAGRWTFAIGADGFASLRSDKEFRFLLHLSRLVNALKFGMAAMNDQGTNTTPRADRQRMNAFLYECGALHEIIDYIEKSVDDVGGLIAYDKVKKALDAQSMNKANAELLDGVRNRAAFHFDPTIAERILPNLPAEPFTFATGDGRRRLDTNYELSDLITFAFLFGHVNNVPAMFAKFQAFQAAVYRVVPAFVEAADDAIFERLRQRGFRFEKETPECSEDSTQGQLAGDDPVVASLPSA